MGAGAGRYAPSPSGDLHFGNLRTAALAWLCARSTGRDFLMRVEDIDSERSTPESARRQLEDLEAIGLDWDAPLIHQSERQNRYEEVLAELEGRGLIYECYCSRKDIREATSAPHVTPGVYPGTCRDLTEQQREERRAAMGERGSSLRIRSDAVAFTVHDLYAGEFTGEVDDFVIRRGNGDFAYNFVAVIDDGETGVDQVVRGYDLLTSAPRQGWFAQLLGFPVPEYVHVPLVLGPEGKRMSKRDGAVTLREMGPVEETVRQLCVSIGHPEASSLAEVLSSFDAAELSRQPVTWPLA